MVADYILSIDSIGTKVQNPFRLLLYFADPFQYFFSSVNIHNSFQGHFLGKLKNWQTPSGDFFNGTPSTYIGTEDNFLSKHDSQIR